MDGYRPARGAVDQRAADRPEDGLMGQDKFKYFRIEAREILDGLAQGLLHLERRAEPDVVARF